MVLMTWRSCTATAVRVWSIEAFVSCCPPDTGDHLRCPGYRLLAAVRLRLARRSFLQLPQRGGRHFQAGLCRVQRDLQDRVLQGRLAQPRLQNGDDPVRIDVES